MDDDIDSDEDVLLPKAFSVKGKPSFDGPAATAEEYLRRVKWEAKQIPNVVVADINPREYDQFQTKQLPNYVNNMNISEFEPHNDWCKDISIDYTFLRQMIRRYKDINECDHIISFPNKKEQWISFCLTKDELKDTEMSNSELSTNGIEFCEPLLSVICQLTHLQTLQALNSLIEFVIESKCMPKHCSLWLYSLLAILDKPLQPDTSALLRKFRRELNIIRDTMENSDETLLTHINIINTVILNTFLQ